MEIDRVNRPVGAVDRPLWRELLERQWRERRVIWLTGPRRLGKTTLVRSLPDTDYFDCDLPRVRRDVEDTEGFLKRHRGRRIALDEIHRLADPSNLLKVAADHFPDIHVVATGSSTLGASARFRDTLAGRKRTVRLLPVLHREIAAFQVPTPERRLLHGGLPEHLTRSVLPERDFEEWIEAFWARDILELFSVGKRYSFLRFLELLWAQSGGMCELTGFTAACEASRQTLANYLDIFAATGVVHADGSAEVLVTTAGGPALFVTLTTLAAGRFSENAFHVGGSGGVKALAFFPLGGGAVQLDVLQASLRVEHLGLYGA